MAPGSTGEPYDTIRAPVFLWQAVFYHQDPRSFLLCRIQSPLLPLLHVSIRLLFLVIIIKHLMKHHLCTKLCYFFLDDRGKRILYPAMVHFVSGCDYCCFSDHKRLYIKNRSVIAYVRSRLQLILFYDKRYDSCSGELITLFSQWYCRASLLSSFHQRS